MSRITLHAVPEYKRPAVLLRRWGASLGVWGVGFGIYALYYLSVTPLMKREVLVKVPVIGSYYEDKTPASDKPF